jgi:cell division septum initiation protein DivIVA
VGKLDTEAVVSKGVSMAVNATKEHWGVKFTVASEGLAEEEVVAFVNGLMEKMEESAKAQEQQSSLLKLAEQTVIEADRLAERIKEDARKSASTEAEKVLAAAEEKAQEQVKKLLQKAEREAAERSSAAIAEAQREAQELLRKAQKEAQEVLQSARDQAAAIHSDARLEAEFIVRRVSAQVAEEIRSAMTSINQSLLSKLETQAPELFAPGEQKSGDKAIGPGAARSASTAAPKR